MYLKNLTPDRNHMKFNSNLTSNTIKYTFDFSKRFQEITVKKYDGVMFLLNQSQIHDMMKK